MDIQKINRRHFVETDLFYRINLGLSSKLIKYENGVIHLEITLGQKWHKNYNNAASEIANIWKATHAELENAIACKVFIIDLNKSPHKLDLIKSNISPGYDGQKGIIFRKNILN